MPLCYPSIAELRPLAGPSSMGTHNGHYDYGSSRNAGFRGNTFAERGSHSSLNDSGELTEILSHVEPICLSRHCRVCKRMQYSRSIRMRAEFHGRRALPRIWLLSPGKKRAWIFKPNSSNEIHGLLAFASFAMRRLHLLRSMHGGLPCKFSCTAWNFIGGISERMSCCNAARNHSGNIGSAKTAKGRVNGRNLPMEHACEWRFNRIDLFNIPI